MRISDWSSDVCSSDLEAVQQGRMAVGNDRAETPLLHQPEQGEIAVGRDARPERQPALGQPCIADTAVLQPLLQRSGERPGGKECVSKCRSSGVTDQYKKKTDK